MEKDMEIEVPRKTKRPLLSLSGEQQEEGEVRPLKKPRTSFELARQWNTTANANNLFTLSNEVIYMFMEVLYKEDTVLGAIALGFLGRTCHHLHLEVLTFAVKHPPLWRSDSDGCSLLYYGLLDWPVDNIRSFIHCLCKDALDLHPRPDSSKLRRRYKKIATLLRMRGNLMYERGENIPLHHDLVLDVARAFLGIPWHADCLRHIFLEEMCSCLKRNDRDFFRELATFLRTHAPFGTGGSMTRIDTFDNMISDADEERFLELFNALPRQHPLAGAEGPLEYFRSTACLFVCYRSRPRCVRGLLDSLFLALGFVGQLMFSAWHLDRWEILQEFRTNTFKPLNFPESSCATEVLLALLPFFWLASHYAGHVSLRMLNLSINVAVRFFELLDATSDGNSNALFNLPPTKYFRTDEGDSISIKEALIMVLLTFHQASSSNPGKRKSLKRLYQQEIGEQGSKGRQMHCLTRRFVAKNTPAFTLDHKDCQWYLPDTVIEEILYPGLPDDLVDPDDDVLDFGEADLLEENHNGDLDE